jgi:hypothetical protein
MPHLEAITTPLIVDPGIGDDPYGEQLRADDNSYIQGADDSHKGENWPILLSFFTKLRFVDIEDNRYPVCRPFCNQSVTTIKYQWEMPPIPFWIKRRDDVPNLKNFCFNSFQFPVLITLLEVIGVNLVRLTVANPFRTAKAMPDRLWSLCPRLERLDCCGLLQTPPPPKLPLHTISVFFPCIPSSQKTYYTPFQSVFLLTLGGPGGASVRRVIVQDTWDQLRHLEMVIPHPPDFILHWFLDCNSICEEVGISFEDVDGLRFETSGWQKRLEEIRAALENI